ncbi:MAG: hypothetical protein ISS59_00030 [Desulfobacteraceae bacterium]|nr:hypothetical protein [Desulfobacteraceae bacterium]
MRIDISKLIRSMCSSELQRSSLEKDTLKVGDNLLGRVLEIKNSGKTLIDFGRFRALARTQFPVREGDVIDVKVLEKGIPIRLGLNNPAQKISQQVKKMLSLIEFPPENILEKLQSETRKVLNRNNGIFKGREVPIYVKDILARIAAHFGPMNIGKNSSELSSQLKSYIENSGIFFEKKIENVIIKSFETNEKTSPKGLRESPEIRDIIRKDLKPNIIILKDFLDRKGLMLKILGTKNLEAIRSTVERLLAEMVAQQGDTTVRHDRLESAHALTYALPLEESNQRAKLKVYYSKKNRGKSEEGFKVSLLLAMDKIGQIRTDFFLMDKDLDITFFVNDRNIKEYVDDNSEEIVGSLRNHFKRLTLNVIISEDEIEEFEMKDPGVVSAGIVDLRV